MQYNQDGTRKRAMESDRAHNTLSKTAQRSARPQRARTSRGLRCRIMDFTNWSPQEGLAAAVSAIPDLPQTIPAMCNRGCSGALPKSWQRTCLNEAESIFAKPSSTEPLYRQKRGSCCRQDKARQRHQDHGHRRRFWYSCRRSH